MQSIRESTLEPKEFERSLKAGLGRVILYLKQHSSTPYRHTILHACLHNTSFDPQVEGFKTTDMMEIIDLTEEPDFYRQQILHTTAQINGQTDDRDASHLVELTRLFAQRGNVEARKIIYDLFMQHLDVEDPIGANAIVEIDKVDGFIYVVDKLGTTKQQTRHYMASEFLLAVLEEEIGETNARDALALVRAENPNVDLYLRLVEDQKRKRLQNRSNDKALEGMSYDEIKNSIENEKVRINLNRWGQLADEQSLAQAAHDLLQQDNSQRIYQYLRIFLKAPFPLEPETLFRFIEIEHQFIPVIALHVLSNIRHPAVRELALKRIEQGRFSERGVGLLAYNFENGDWALIEELSRQPLDEEAYHGLEISVQEVFKQHPDREAAQTLLNIYEYGPCSNCRERILLMLKSIDAITEQIQEECLYDSNQYIRELAQNEFEDN